MAGEEVRADRSENDFLENVDAYINDLPEKSKNFFQKKSVRSTMASAAWISITVMSTLIMEMSFRPGVTSVLTHHDLVLTAILMGLTVLAIVCRLDTVMLDCPDSDSVSILKLYFLGVPIVVLDSLLLAKFARVMFVGHMITMKLMVVFVLSVIPLALLAPVLMVEACYGLTSTLLGLVSKALWIAILAAGVGILLAVASPVIVPILAMTIIIVTVEALVYMSHCASYQLGCQEQVPPSGSDDFFPITRGMLEPFSGTQAARQENTANEQPDQQGPAPR